VNERATVAPPQIPNQGLVARADGETAGTLSRPGFPKPASRNQPLIYSNLICGFTEQTVTFQI
jgi:hypothetical protein